MSDVFLSLKVVLILANSADPDEMPSKVAFHLSLHCLPEYLFNHIQNEKFKLIPDVNYLSFLPVKNITQGCIFKLV